MHGSSRVWDRMHSIADLASLISTQSSCMGVQVLSGSSSLHRRGKLGNPRCIWDFEFLYICAFPWVMFCFRFFPGSLNLFFFLSLLLRSLVFLLTHRYITPRALPYPFIHLWVIINLSPSAFLRYSLRAVGYVFLCLTFWKWCSFMRALLGLFAGLSPIPLERLRQMGLRVLLEQDYRLHSVGSAANTLLEINIWRAKFQSQQVPPIDFTTTRSDERSMKKRRSTSGVAWPIRHPAVPS